MCKLSCTCACAYASIRPSVRPSVLLSCDGQERGGRRDVLCGRCRRRLSLTHTRPTNRSMPIPTCQVRRESGGGRLLPGGDARVQPLHPFATGQHDEHLRQLQVRQQGLWHRLLQLHAHRRPAGGVRPAAVRFFFAFCFWIFVARGGVHVCVAVLFLSLLSVFFFTFRASSVLSLGACSCGVPCFLSVLLPTILFDLVRKQVPVWQAMCTGIYDHALVTWICYCCPKRKRMNNMTAGT